MQLLTQVRRNPSTFASPLDELVVEYTQELSQLRTRSGELTGVPTGLVALDRLTDGLQPSDMIMVAAPPATGKTSFVLSIALHAALSTGRPIGMFSLELNHKRLVQRLLAISAQTDFSRLKTGRLEHEKWERVIAASEQLMQATVGGRRLEHRMQEVEEICRVLKVIARELNIPVLVVAQLFRAVESRPLEKSRFSELRGGFLENDADLMLILYRDELYTHESPYRHMVKIIVAKHRNGLVADFYVHFQPEQMRFSDLMTAPEEKR